MIQLHSELQYHFSINLFRILFLLYSQAEVEGFEPTRRVNGHRFPNELRYQLRSYTSKVGGRDYSTTAFRCLNSPANDLFICHSALTDSIFFLKVFSSPGLTLRAIGINSLRMRFRV